MFWFIRTGDGLDLNLEGWVLGVILPYVEKQPQEVITLLDLCRIMNISGRIHFPSRYFHFTDNLINIPIV